MAKKFLLPEPHTPAQYLLWKEFYKDDEKVDVDKVAMPPAPPSDKEAYMYYLTKLVLGIEDEEDTDGGDEGTEE